jgi:predicted ribosomally synthesized peptide with SipW-like signal peptide
VNKLKSKLGKLKLKKSFYIYGSLVLLLVLTLGVTFATFTDRAKFQGTMISVASSDIKLLDTIGGGVDPSNLVDEKPGPVFEEIGNSWVYDYPVQIYNNGTNPVDLTSKADYEDLEVNDPQDLRQEIRVDIYEWDDANGDGIPQDTELGGTHGNQTILGWKNTGYSNLGTIAEGEVKSLVIRFTTGDIDDKQGASFLFDFQFNSTEVSE